MKERDSGVACCMRMRISGIVRAACLCNSCRIVPLSTWIMDFLCVLIPFGRLMKPN